MAVTRGKDVWLEEVEDWSIGLRLMAGGRRAEEASGGWFVVGEMGQWKWQMVG